jgi:hypothetical protein
MIRIAKGSPQTKTVWIAKGSPQTKIVRIAKGSPQTKIVWIAKGSPGTPKAALPLSQFKLGCKMKFDFWIICLIHP